VYELSDPVSVMRKGEGFEHQIVNGSGCVDCSFRVCGL
jgi:hypothetical protein